MDRLARNVEDMLRLVREMNDKGVSVQFIKENISFTAGNDDPRSTLMFTCSAPSHNSSVRSSRSGSVRV
jgi:DNA invertase Pin-like site-specific DNA recombinase